MGVEGNGGEDWGQKQVGSSDKTQEAQGPSWSSPAPSPALAPQSAGLGLRGVALGPLWLPCCHRHWGR